MTTTTPTAVRKPRAAKSTKTATPVKAKPVATKPTAPKAAKPTVRMYDFSNDYTGPSRGINANVSRTRVALDRFGMFKDAKLTDRDQKNIAAMRGQFGTKPFERGNLDVGILRRLGERGIIAHVSGGDTDPQATFRFAKAA